MSILQRQEVRPPAGTGATGGRTGRHGLGGPAGLGAAATPACPAWTAAAPAHPRPRQSRGETLLERKGCAADKLRSDPRQPFSVSSAGEWRAVGRGLVPRGDSFSLK